MVVWFELLKIDGGIYPYKRPVPKSTNIEKLSSDLYLLYCK